MVSWPQGVIASWMKTGPRRLLGSGDVALSVLSRTFHDEGVQTCSMA
jgi:hypothetical protein